MSGTREELVRDYIEPEPEEFESAYLYARNFYYFVVEKLPVNTCL